MLWKVDSDSLAFHEAENMIENSGRKAFSERQ